MVDYIVWAELDDYVTVDEAAERLGLTPRAVVGLAQRGVLRAVYLGAGELLVQPAIITGATT